MDFFFICAMFYGIKYELFNLRMRVGMLKPASTRIAFNSRILTLDYLWNSNYVEGITICSLW